MIEERTKIQKNDHILFLHTFLPHFLQEDVSRSLWFLCYESLISLLSQLKHKLIECKKLSPKWISELFPASLTDITL